MCAISSKSRIAPPSSTKKQTVHKRLMTSGCWLCLFLLNVQCRILAPEDMEKEPERGQEQCHSNKSANKQRQLCGRWTGSIAYCHRNRNQVGKLRQPPGSKNEGCYGEGQHTSQAIAPQ